MSCEVLLLSPEKEGGFGNYNLTSLICGRSSYQILGSSWMCGVKLVNQGDANVAASPLQDQSSVHAVIGTL